MNSIRNGIAIVLAGGFFALCIMGIAYPQGAVTLVNCVAGCGGSGGGGAVTIANGADTAEGTTTDSPATVPTSSTAATVIGLLKAIANAIISPAVFPLNITPTDCSGTIGTGGTAQAAIAAQTTLHGFTIGNIDTGHNDEVLWISFTGTATALTAGSFPLSAPTATSFTGLATYSTPAGFGSNHAVSVVGATTGHIFSCTWW